MPYLNENRLFTSLYICFSVSRGDKISYSTSIHKAIFCQLSASLAYRSAHTPFGRTPHLPTVPCQMELNIWLAF